MSLKWLWLTGLIATLGAVVTGTGEWLMLYSPTMGYGATAGHQNFLYPSPELLAIGFYLGILGAPLYVVGYWHIASMLKLQGAVKTGFISVAVFGFMIGSVWLGTNAYLGLLKQAGAEILLLQIEALSEPLLQIVRLAVLSLSVIMITQIWRGKTFYSRWVILLTPFLLILYVLALYLMWPTVGNYVLPAALNVAHSLFFALSTFWAFRYSKTCI